MNKVFVPHIVTRYDRETGRITPVMDFSAAALHGELTTVLEESDNPLFLNMLMAKIRRALESFDDNDCLLCVGDPTLIAACAAVIARRNPKITMLKWDKSMKHYIKVEVRL